MDEDQRSEYHREVESQDSQDPEDVAPTFDPTKVVDD